MTAAGAITERTLDAYRADVRRTSGEELTRAEAWNDFADAYGWELEENPYSDEAPAEEVPA